MADGHGGKRTPTNPAPVSGPGSMSKRTDGKQPAMYMSGGPYGEGQDLMELQTSAPMAEAPSVPRPRMGRSGGGMATSNGRAVTPLFAPTERPEEPLTAGAPFGPGPGPAYTPKPRGSLTSTLEKLVAFDDTGQLAAFYRMAQSRGW